MPYRLPARKAAVLKCIEAFAKRGYSPRYSEIAKIVGLRSASAAQYQVMTLEKMGYLKPRPKGQHRSIALAERAA